MLDVRTKAPFADWLIICSAHTSSHVRAIADGITQDMRQCGLLIAGEVVGVCGRDSDDWMVVDVGPVLVHVMTEDARAHYALERLWTSEVEIDNSEQV